MDEVVGAVQNSKPEITIFTSGTTGQPKKVVHSIATLTRSVRLGDRYKGQIWAYAYNPTHMAGLQVFFLHYQPEQTTCPCGDIFVDQKLCVELLLKHLPLNYKIYIKEHPSQFNRYLIGHSSRMSDLYNDLVKNERVKLISTDVDSFELIKHTKAVSTITGTVGWEAMVRQKPVIAFGLV